MKKRTVLFCGILLIALCTATAFADTIDVFYNDIQVYVDGALTEFVDANGNPVEPFIYNGNVYLPLPAVAEAMGMSYSWNGSTMSAYVGAQPGATQYLLDVCMPYQKDNVTLYTSSNGDSFLMAGQTYINGLTFEFRDNGPFALFNLNGQYKMLRFTVGHRDGKQMKDGKIQIYLDGKLAAEYMVGAEDLPKEYVLDLNHALSMKITGVESAFCYGVANIVIE